MLDSSKKHSFAIVLRLKIILKMSVFSKTKDESLFSAFLTLGFYTVH